MSNKQNKFKHHHIYIKRNSAGAISSYRVLFRHDDKVTDRTFSVTKYENPLKSAIEFRDENLICKRKDSATGIVGVYKVCTNLHRGDTKDYVGYRSSWFYIDVKGNTKSKSRSFLYRSDIITSDTELHAFRCASRFNNVACWYKLNGMVREFHNNLDNNVYPNLEKWKECSPENLFIV